MAGLPAGLASMLGSLGGSSLGAAASGPAGIASALGGTALGGLTGGILPQLLKGQNPFTGPMSAYGLAQSAFGGGGSGNPQLAQLKQKLLAAGVDPAQVDQILARMGGGAGGGGFMQMAQNAGIPTGGLLGSFLGGGSGLA